MSWEQDVPWRQTQTPGLSPPEVAVRSFFGALTKEKHTLCACRVPGNEPVLRPSCLTERASQQAHGLGSHPALA